MEIVESLEPGEPGHLGARDKSQSAQPQESLREPLRQSSLAIERGIADRKSSKFSGAVFAGNSANKSANKSNGVRNQGTEVADLLLQIMAQRKVRHARLASSMQQMPQVMLTKNLLGGVVGNVLEWFDFAVFGFFAPVIGVQFFPSKDPVDSLLGAFSVFAAAFLVRPIGGAIFGYIGDQLGRKQALQLSVMMMAIPTFMIGVLPTHDQIGVLAPILLVLLRIIQGLSVGGELIGSISFVAEMAPEPKRGFYSSWTFASCYCGIMLGSLSAVLLNVILGEEAVASWGWRLPFLAGILIGLAGLWMRRELHETPVFEKMKSEQALVGNPIAEVIHELPWRIFHAAALAVLVGGGFYMLFVWWPTLLSRFVHPAIENGMLLNTVCMLLLIGLIPIVGRLSDEVGRKPLLVLGAGGMMVFSVPLFSLVQHGSVESALFAQLCFTVLMALFLGPIPATLVEMFPARVRFSAIGLSYNVALSIFGGSAPLLATWLMRTYHSVSAPALYLTWLAGISLVAAIGLPKLRVSH